MRPETKALYPPDWPEISRRTIEARGKRCQKCGRGPDVCVLTTHHKDHNPANNDDTNFEVLCQACHLDEERTFLRLTKKEGQIVAGQLVLLEWKQPKEASVSC